MRKRADIPQNGRAAKNRQVFAYAAAAVSCAFLVSMVPGHAFATDDAEEDQLPVGKLTVVVEDNSTSQEIPDTGSASTSTEAPSASGESDDVPGTPTEVEAETPADSSEQEQEITEQPAVDGDEPGTTEASTSTEEESTASQHDSGKTTSDDDSASSKEQNDQEQAAVIDEDHASTPADDSQEDASNSSNYIEDKSVADSDIHNNSPGEGCDEDSRVFVSPQSITDPEAYMVDDLAQGSILDGAISTASAKATIYLDKGFEDPNYANTDSVIQVGPTNDYFFYPDGQWLTSSRTYEITWTGNWSDFPGGKNGLMRCNYNLSGYVINYTQGRNRNAFLPVGLDDDGDTLTKLANATIHGIYPIWNVSTSWTLFYYAFPIDGKSPYSTLDLPDTNEKSLSNVNTSWTIPLPTESSTASMEMESGYKLGGYYFLIEHHNTGTQAVRNDRLAYVAQPGAHKLTGTETVWDMLRIVFPDYLYEGCTYSSTNIDAVIAAGDKNLVVVAALAGDTEDLSYTVQYYNANAGNSSFTKVGLSSGTDAVPYTTAEANAEKLADLGITVPGASGGYTYSFKGWAVSEDAAKAGEVKLSTDGAAFFTNMWGDNTPSTDGAYTLYAVWSATPQTFKVNYYPTETTGFSATPTSKAETPEVPAANATNSTVVAKSAGDLWGARAGYTFMGWATTDALARAGTVEHAAGKTLKDINDADVTSSTVLNLYAVWRDDNYTVTYEANSGTGTISNPYKYSPGTTTLSDMPSLTRDGYTFGGWNESGTKVADADGKLTDAFKSAATAGTTHTLTAIWNEITYKINWYTRWNSSGPISGYSWQSTLGATSSSTVLSGLGEAATATPDSTEGSANYYRQSDGSGNTLQFKGWYLIKSGSAWDTPASGTVALGNSTLADALSTLKSHSVTVTDTITVYGIWERLGSATVSYSSNDATFNGKTWNSTVTKSWADSPYAGDPYVVDGKEFVPGYSFGGRHFVKWNTKADGTGTDYANDDRIGSIVSMTLYAQWADNAVKFELYPGASDTGIELNSKSASELTAKMADVVKPSDLVTAAPTRSNYEFKGWTKTEGGTVADVVLGPAETNTYTITATDASSDGAVVKLYAVWEELTYTVSYYANPGTDTSNSVTLKHTTGTQSTVTSPYTWTAKTRLSDTGLDQPDISASRNWYKFEGWAVSDSASASDVISSTATVGQLLTAAGETSRALKLYAVWSPISFTVNYAPKGTNGSVSLSSETVNLATGSASSISGSTATADTASGWQLATPTWTDSDGNAVTGVDTTNPQATYKPTVAYLRTLYTQVPGSSSYTFYANFEEQTLAYTVDVYLQQANGNYLSKGASNWGDTFTRVGGSSFAAKLGTVIKAMGEGATTVSGFTLAELLPESSSTDGVSNAYLYTLDGAKTDADGKREITIGVDTSKNVISLYYARTIYDLTSAFQTKNAAGSVVKEDKPDGATDVNAVSSYINGGNSTTGLRWGQSITVTSPSTTGYDFAWSISSPSSAVSTVPGTSFSLKAADMKAIADAAASGTTPVASLLGIFTVKTVSVTFDDTDANSSHNWTGSGNAATVASALKSGSYTYTKTGVAYNETLGGWVPDFTDATSVDYYFAGWYDAADSTQTTFAKDVLESMTNWTENKTFRAKWMEKLLITYDAGDKDSNGDSKAAWSTTSVRLSEHDASKTIAQTVAKFSEAVASGEGSDNLPQGAPGWVFDYWTLAENDYRIGHNGAYEAGAGYHVYPSDLYLNGTDTTTGFATSRSYTFVAHWKPVAQIFTVSTTGSVVNNDENKGTASGSLPTGLPLANYVTDQHIVLSDYALTNVEAGYELAGWAYVYTPSEEAKAKGAAGASGTYGVNDDFYLRPGTTVLTPRFNEKTVTFTYVVAPESNGRGSVNGTTTDSVFAVTHNRVTTHTAQVATADGYTFVKWTLDGADVEKDGTLVGATLTADDLGLTGVLTEDRTYYANFDVRKYWVTFANTGTDGSSTMGDVTLDGSKTGYSLVHFGYQVDYNTGVPNGAVSVTVPEGYELDGWIVNGTGGVQAPSGTAANLQGVYNFKPTTGDITLTPHFKVSTALNYTVNYVYDPEGISGFSHTETSRAVAWGDLVYPENANAKSPTANGYDAKGWRISFDSSGKTYGSDVADVGGAKFGAIYDKLVADNASNVDTSSKAITIYFMWEAKKYTVSYDFYGNVSDDTGTSNDDVKWTISGYDQPNTDVTWNDQANTFWRQSITRPGYTLDHFYATVNTGTGVSTTSSNVGETDKFGALATATDGTIYNTVTLHAFWKSVQYDVLYDYSYTPAGESSPKTETKQHGWAEDVDFFTEGGVPSRDGWRFGGWEVHYTGNDTPNHLADITAETLTSAGTTTIRDLRHGDIALVDNTSSIGNPAVTLKALWVQEASYYFQDTLIWADGTRHDVTDAGGRTSSTNVAGNSTVNFSSYGYEHGKSTYEGYDFDEHDASNPAVPGRTVATQRSATATAGSTLVYHVYYIERTYTLNFFAEDTDATAKATTLNNPYTSAAIDLSTVADPAKAGWTFAGWYLTDGTNRVRIDGSDPKKISDLYATAPANGSALKVVADWEPLLVRISWSADANGSVSSSATSPDERSANSTDAAAAITATPDSTDYVFDKWTYSYTDADGNTQTGDVTETSEFATLSKSSADLTAFDVLTPKQWSDGLWHDIAFTAHFVTSSALKVRVEYYLEDGDNPGTYAFKEYETRSDASDNELYTVTNPKTFAGYSLNTGMTLPHVYKLEDADTHTFKVYLDANTYTVSYRYVASDAEGAATQTDIPSGVGLPTTPYTGSFRTGQTVTVAPEPSAEGWTFSGWYKNRATGSTVNGTVAMPASDLEFVGMWERVYHTVRFINDATSSAAVDGTTVSMATSDGSSVSGYSVAHGAKVKTSADAAVANATTLVDFGVTANNNGKGWKLSGWKAMDTKTGTWLSETVYGSIQVLDFEPKQDVTFVAQWAETYAVTYDPGMHGAFGTKSYSRIDINDPANAQLNVNGSSVAEHAFYGNDNNGVPVIGADGKPKAVAGYSFAGWGVNNGTWTYYFDYNANVDYGASVSNYGNGTTLPTTVTGNIDFVAFYERLERTVQFMATEYDGTTDGKAYDPSANFNSGVTTTQAVRTGLYATMLGVNDITRDGYKLDHWTTDGTDSYAPGSSNEFQMGEYADGTIVRLYPVFAYDTIEINYTVADGQGAWGTVDRSKDTKTTSSSAIVGSKATPGAGYEFEKWTLSGSDAALTAADGLQADGVTLKPSAAGTYIAHFKQKVYTFSVDNGGYTDAQNVSAPTRTDGTSDPIHWTDSMTMGTPTLAGYTFDGWDVYESSDYSTNGTNGTKLHSGMTGNALVSALSNSDGTATGLVLAPSFSPLTYQVTFEAGDADGDHKVTAGTMPAAYSGAYDGDVSFAAPTRDGYTFKHWAVAVTSTTDGSTIAPALADTSSLSDAHALYKVLAGNEKVSGLTLTAVWEAVSHKLNYAKSGEFEGGTVEGTWSSTGSDYPESNDPAYSDTTKAEADIELGTDTVVTLRGAATLTKSGYKLLGWNDGTTDYKFGEDGTVSFTMPNTDVTLTPIWDQPGEYSVVFANGTADGAAVADADITGKPSDRSNLRYSADDILTGKPALKGYEFLGWDSNGNGTADVTDYTAAKTYASLAGSDAVKTVTLTALWQKRSDYVVTFEPGASSGVSGLPYGTETTPHTKSGLSWDSNVTTLAGSPAAAPTRSGWAFDGWKVYTDPEHMHQVSTVSKSGEAYPETVVFSALANNTDSDSLHLYLVAQWSEVGTYSVTFNANADGDAVTQLPDGQDNLTWGATVTTRHADGKPVRAGYTFAGWTVKDAAGNELRTGYDDASATYEGLANSNDVPQIVLWAQWTPKSAYKVQFDANASGDTTVDSAKIPSTQDGLAWNAAVTTLVGSTEADKPTRAGYTFAGWTVFASDGTTQIGDDARVTGNSYSFSDLAIEDLDGRASLWLRAVWTPVQNTLTYHLSKGSWSDGTTGDATEQHGSGTDVTPRAKTSVTRDGYKLVGWQDADPDSGGTASKAYYVDSVYASDHGLSVTTTFSMPVANYELWPIWDVMTYTVHFADGVVSGISVTSGTMPTDPQTVAYDGNVSHAAPTRTGYTFGGWDVYRTSEVVGGVAADGATKLGAVDKDVTESTYSALAKSAQIDEITLIAIWTANKVALSYILTDGEGAWVAANVKDGGPTTLIASIDYDVDTDVLLRAEDTVHRDGYVLVGWQTSTNEADAGYVLYSFDTTTGEARLSMPAANVLLYPKWNLRSYKVTFDGNAPTGENVIEGAVLNNVPNTQPAEGDTLTWTGAKSVVGTGAPTFTGWEFRGWTVYDMNGNVVGNTSVESGTPLMASTYNFNVLAANEDLAERRELKLVANWRLYTYTVVFEDGVESGATPITGTLPADYEGTFGGTVSFHDLVRTGYTFGGWTVADVTDSANVKTLTPVAAGETSAAFSTLADSIDSRRHLKMVAIWNVKTGYRVTFVGQEDDGTPAADLSGFTNYDNIAWNGDVRVYSTVAGSNGQPTRLGYTFGSERTVNGAKQLAGWAVRNTTDADNPVSIGYILVSDIGEFKYSDLAVNASTGLADDSITHITLVALWEPCKYRVTYVDPTDADGATAATPATIVSNADLLWGDDVSNADPWSVYGASYTGKTTDKWRFDGWFVRDSSGTLVPVSEATGLEYGTLADMQGLTLADSATDGETPALVLYASWTRFVPYVVDFVKLPVAAGGTADAGTEVVDGSTTLVGLDGQSIADLIAGVLDLGDAHAIVGYAYNRDGSAADSRNAGTLKLSMSQLENPLHLVLLYDQLLDYAIVYNAAPGKNASGATTATKAGLAWDTPAANFAPTDADWAYTGHKIVGWTYGPTGKEITFATDGLTFGQIAAAIYGTVDGSEGRSADKPVTLFAVWAERTDYKVKYDDNYDPNYDNNVVDKFLGRVEDATFTPGAKADVAWSSSDLAPTGGDQIVQPGIKDGIALYQLDGWNYSATNDGKNQKPIEGKTFEDIAKEIFGDNEPDNGEIVLYARWKEIEQELKYTPVVVELDGTGSYVQVTGGKAGGTVSRTSELISSITGTADTTGASLVAQGANVTVNPGFHFVGWRRVSDGETVYVRDWDPATLRIQSLADGNVMPSTTDAATLFAVMQNTADGYWHEEEYQALFAQNATAVLHYDKNAEDATGTIADVQEPHGSLVDLSDGKAYSRPYWTLKSWNTAADGSGTTYAPGLANFVMPEGETTLFAQWERNDASFVYVANGTDVKGLPSGTTTKWGAELSVSENEPTRAHHTFLGWNTKADGTGESYELGEEFTLTGDGLTLYAQWSVNKYPVTAKTDGQPGGKVTTSGNGPIDVEYGGHVPEGYYTATPDDGYHLKGWKYTIVDEDGTVTTGIVSDPSQLEITGTATFEPVFEEDAPAEASDTAGAPSTSSGTRSTTSPSSGRLAKTADPLGMLMGMLAATALAAALAMLILVFRRRDDA